MRHVPTATRLVLHVLVALTLVLPGCFLKLPRTPEADLFPSADGRGGDGSGDLGALDNAVSPTDWQWWAPDIPDIGPEPDGQQGLDYTGGDVAPEDAIAYTWNCNYETTEFAPSIEHHSFIRTAQELGEQDFVIGYNWVCGTDDTNLSPERGYLFQVDRPTGLSVRLRGDGECYGLLYRNGCQYDGLEACFWDGADEAQLTADLLPGLYMVAVEFMAPGPLDPVPPGHTFDLHVALNNTLGDEACHLDTVTPWSALTGSCQAGDIEVVKSTSVAGTLSWQSVDDVNTGCAHFGAAADKLGGMPDEVHAFQADFAEGPPRVLDVTLSLPAGGPGALLALTTDPCGAAEAVVDCAWGDGPTLTLSGISLFPNEQVYAVVDGLGADAFAFGDGFDYTLSWDVHDPCN